MGNGLRWSSESARLSGARGDAVRVAAQSTNHSRPARTHRPRGRAADRCTSSRRGACQSSSSRSLSRSNAVVVTSPPFRALSADPTLPNGHPDQYVQAACNPACLPSDAGRITRRVTLLEHATATAEFLVVDTETNGLGGEACELTEVGAVLVGGGELHDRCLSLVRCNRPLGRGIQRFTGITQEMLADAPGLEEVLPGIAERLEGRVLVAHNAPFDRRVLRRGFELIGLEWPNPPVLCTAALARKLLPLQNRRGLSVLADALGIEVEIAHRALADAETCARVLCALFPRLCANALTIADAVAITEEPAPPHGRPQGQACPPPRRRRSSTSPTCPAIRVSTCSATAPVGCSTSASRSRSAAGPVPTSRPRACPPTGLRRPPWSTTRARTRSSGRSCSRTG